MFPPVEAVPDFVAIEAEIAGHWKSGRVFERSMSDRAGSPEYIFFEGPPTANGRPGLHHVWSRVYKDLFCRFQTMRGRLVERHAGWDTHGLPVEVEVEKQLGFTGKGDIERYGIAEFVEACRESVRTYVDEWARFTDRIGFFVDLDAAYWTLDPHYIESVWWHLKQLSEKGLLFEDVKVVPYCYRCGTGLSSHELGQPDVYREVTDQSVFVRLPIVGTGPHESEALIIWTTTPWTLVSNAGVAVNPELIYVVIDGLVVAEDLADVVLGEGATERATARFPGVDLVGTRYRRPIDLVEVSPEADAWRVVPGTFVTALEGTGLVHMSPAFGADDWAVGRREGLPTINPVGPDGRFLDAGRLSGKLVKEVDAEIIEMLENAGLLVRAVPHLHPYPHCWRCGTTLIYWGKPSWYVATQQKKADLIAANETIQWQPGYIKHGRFGEWLENNVDWALSRDRYWGTPLPIWRCEQRHVQCVGSLSELSELAGRDVTGIDPHRPVIDEVKFACPECGGVASRVEAVIDAWFDSGSMPAAQWGYPALQGSQDRLRIPADFICEAVDQTRGWFYSLLAVNVLVFGEAPYRNVLSLGHMVDDEGKKMSKSLGNTIDPWTVLDTRGADPLRWWMFHQGLPWTSTRTSLEAIDTSTSAIPMTLWNTWNFFSTYASLNGFGPSDLANATAVQQPEFDRWVASRCTATITEVSDALESYAPFRATEAIAAFVEDLSNWYVRCNRRRFWKTDPELGPEDELSAHVTLYRALVTCSLLLAPLCPFLADRIWRHLTGAGDLDSVHLVDWPLPDPDARDIGLEAEMDLARRLVSLGRAARSESGVKVRQPLRRALVVLPPDSPKVLAKIVSEQLNVDEVVSITELGDVVSFELVPNFRSLGPKLGEAVKEVRGALDRLDVGEVAGTLERDEPVEIELSSGSVVLGPGDVELRVKSREGFAVSREGVAAVALDLQVDEALRTRGMVRDVIRQIQALRRERGLQMSDRIVVNLMGVDELQSWSEEIGREVLAQQVGFFSGAGDPSELEIDDGRQATVWIEKVADD